MEAIGVVDILALGKSRKTAREYARVLRNAEAFLAGRATNLMECNALDVAELAETVKLSHSSRAHLRGALRAAWEILGRADGPIRAVRVPPAPPGVCRALESSPAQLLEAAAWARNDDAGLAVLIGLYAALRRFEIAKIHSTDIEYDTHKVPAWLKVVGKFEKTRTVPVHPMLATAISRAHKAGYFFPGRFGGYCNPDTIWRYVKQVAGEGGLDIAPHVLRHTCLAEANDRGGDLRTVQEIAGHSRPETTAIYTRTTRARMSRVIALVDYGHRLDDGQKGVPA